jgi:putative transposase
MPRPLRHLPAGVPVHAIQRGNNRNPTFTDRTDFDSYLRFLREGAHDTGCAIHAYVLMSNHVHLLVTPAVRGAVSDLMQRLGRRYVPWYNERHGRTGTLWEGRFRSALVTSESHLLACARYIELNPVRAGMVGAPEHYSWSSHAANAFGRVDPLVTPHPVLRALGSPWQAAYRDLFAIPLLDETLAGIRAATAHRSRPRGKPVPGLGPAAG